MTRLVGLYREAECSPGRHRSNDTLLLEQVAECLRASGYDVELAPIDGIAARRGDAALIFSMCQGPTALERLAVVALRGAVEETLPAVLDDDAV